MKKQQKLEYPATHLIGSIVSTMRRFASPVHYAAAVRAEYISRPPHQQLPADYPLGDSFSFHNHWVDTELLFLHLPGGGGPTSNSNRGIDIPYYYVGDMTLDEFRKYYEANVNGSNRVEPPDSSPRGPQDKPITHRAVFKRNKQTGLSYEGFITNPPYPAKKRDEQPSKSKWLLPAVLGLAAGLAAIPLIRALRVRPKD